MSLALASFLASDIDRRVSLPLFWYTDVPGLPKGVKRMGLVHSPPSIRILCVTNIMVAKHPLVGEFPSDARWGLRTFRLTAFPHLLNEVGSSSRARNESASSIKRKSLSPKGGEIWESRIVALGIGSHYRCQKQWARDLVTRLKFELQGGWDVFGCFPGFDLVLHVFSTRIMGCDNIFTNLFLTYMGRIERKSRESRLDELLVD
ncbi:hypothetical protein Tco_0588846 [Tanacetum coccineum]